MKILLSFATIFVVVSLSLSLPRPIDRIVGGFEVDIKDVPFQVSLYGSDHFCGGSLISKRFVLTAAHCTEDKILPEPLFDIRIGSTYSDRGGIMVRPIRVLQHPLYNRNTIDYDFALVELDDYDMSDLSIEMQYAKLPKQNDIADGTILTASGWGNTKNPDADKTQLRAVNLPKVNEDVCKVAYPLLTERMLCAGFAEGGKDSCQGDSGGPLAHNGTLVGVVSWGSGCALPDYPGVYARVFQILPWIAKTTGLEL
uniref:trypsin n=3 Tax=Haematobia irritans TaxID=7368 RepID=A0A1L8EG63_HAEIR